MIGAVHAILVWFSMVSVCDRQTNRFTSNIYSRLHDEVRVWKIKSCNVGDGKWDFKWFPGEAWQCIRQLIACVDSKVEMSWSK